MTPVCVRLLFKVLLLLYAARTAQEECQQVQASLREAEARCRDLRHQLDDAKGRESRLSAAAAEAREHAAADAGMSQ